jgi:hypothetical protein
VYELCKKDYPDILEELEKEEFCGLEKGESEISHAKGLVCTLLLKVGWISFFVALSLCFVKKTGDLGKEGIVLCLMMDLFRVVLMIQEIVELVLEHWNKLYHILPKSNWFGIWYTDLGRRLWGCRFPCLHLKSPCEMVCAR